MGPISTIADLCSGVRVWSGARRLIETCLAVRGEELWRLDRRGRISRLVGERPMWMPMALPEGGHLPVALEALGDQLFLATTERVYRWRGEAWEPAGGQLPGEEPRRGPAITALESYLREHSEAVLSHGFCPECFERITSALDAAKAPS